MMTAARSALLLGSVAWGGSAGLAPGSTWSILSRCMLSQWAFLRVNFLHTEGEVRAGGGQGGAGGVIYQSGGKKLRKVRWSENQVVRRSGGQ